jgi:hypothetical protein
MKKAFNNSPPLLAMIDAFDLVAALAVARRSEDALYDRSKWHVARY